MSLYSAGVDQTVGSSLTSVNLLNRTNRFIVVGILALGALITLKPVALFDGETGQMRPMCGRTMTEGCTRISAELVAAAVALAAVAIF